ncbi:hypothetical protein B0T11DRAFT_322222 [Plectosphaerella cucumerina]|uniref:Uncharacterized protein n=1 Tax=Plectosphaerella cucumerina TaxID=40658 RepID=A0A8K0WZ25_9PEZI|nr:hypothetical protein B0T11DRAFT_322222 [Plectosphaerella cucumerina]
MASLMTSVCVPVLVCEPLQHVASRQDQEKDAGPIGLEPGVGRSIVWVDKPGGDGSENEAVAVGDMGASRTALWDEEFLNPETQLAQEETKGAVVCIVVDAREGELVDRADVLVPRSSFFGVPQGQFGEGGWIQDVLEVEFAAHGA